jgi:hypothetical protein
LYTSGKTLNGQRLYRKASLTPTRLHGTSGQPTKPAASDVGDHTSNEILVVVNFCPRLWRPPSRHSDTTTTMTRFNRRIQGSVDTANAQDRLYEEPPCQGCLKTAFATTESVGFPSGPRGVQHTLPVIWGIQEQRLEKTGGIHTHLRQGRRNRYLLTSVRLRDRHSLPSTLGILSMRHRRR